MADSVPMLAHMHKNVSLIGSAQSAKAFGVDRATFNRWVAAGEVPIAYDPPSQTGARLFDANVIAELAEQHRAGRLEPAPAPVGAANHRRRGA